MAASKVNSALSTLIIKTNIILFYIKGKMH